MNESVLTQKQDISAMRDILKTHEDLWKPVSILPPVNTDVLIYLPGLNNPYRIAMFNGNTWLIIPEMKRFNHNASDIMWRLIPTFVA